MKKATIYDYSRLCKAQNGRNGKCPICEKCPLGAGSETNNYPCYYLLQRFPDKANEIILKWCKEHPIETRQDRFLKMFPNAKPLLYICPSAMGYKVECPNDCDKCRRDYWLAEVDE